MQLRLIRLRRGQTMTSINKGLMKAKRIDNGEWVYGFYSRITDHYTPKNIHYINTYTDISEKETIITELFEVDPDTLCIPSGITDGKGIKGKMLWTGDIVDFFGMIGVVTFEHGAFGIRFKEYIDWDIVKENCPYDFIHSCRNDNFVSLWELLWNFDNKCPITVLGNIYDNPELLNKEEIYEKD